MQVEIVYRPAFSLAVVSLQPNEAPRRGGRHGQHVRWHGAGDQRRRWHHGGAQALAPGRRELFRERLSGPAPGAPSPLAPPCRGHVHHGAVGRALMVQSGSYVASSEEIQIDTKFGGAKTFSPARGFLLRCTGHRHPHPLELWRHPRDTARAGPAPDGDTGHLVAFNEGWDHRARVAAQVDAVQREGLVVDLTGPGHVLMQTRSTDAFLTWLMPQVQRRMPNRGG